MGEINGIPYESKEERRARRAERLKRGERFLQLIFIPGTNIVAHNSHDLPTHGESRGGFGSTGE